MKALVVNALGCGLMSKTWLSAERRLFVDWSEERPLS